MLNILYIAIFVFTIVLEVKIAEKSKGKRWLWIIIYILLCAIGIIVGEFLGAKTGMVNGDVLLAIATRKVGAIHGLVFVPISVLLYVYLYKIKKLNLVFTIIFILETLGITLGAFFLFLIN